jgi:3-oxo-5-alpha-steroid 4-dehydrogenase 1
MEMVSPISFLTAFLSSPLTRPVTSLKRFPLSPPPIFSQVSFAGFHLSVPSPPTILALLFLGHYANRAVLSPLRTPARSKSHIVVPLAAVLFNIVNGSLMGAFLAGLATSAGKSGSGIFWFLGNSSVIANWTFWVGVGMWAVGFASNIWHDEILLNIRRTSKPSAQGKDKDKEGSKDGKPHYAIPRGGLYALISYPNYFSEWFEWLGYAIAASALTEQLASTNMVFPFAGSRLGLGEALSAP